MNRWLLGSGAIASSALAIYGWTHPSALNLSVLAQPIDPSKPLPKEMEVSYDRLLKQARLVASRNQYAQAITAISGIPKNSRLYGEARQLQEGWTQELLQRARSQYKQANVQMALWMIDAIPSDSLRYPRAAELRKRWSQESALLRQANAAKDTGDWNAVMTALKSLQDSVLYQSPPAQVLLQQATARLSGSGKIAKLAAAGGAIANAPVIPSMANPQATLPSISIPSPSNLPIDRAQALRWAEPPAANPNDMLVSEQMAAPNINGLDNAPAPEFVPLEWAPKPSSATPSSPSMAQNSTEDLSNMPAPNRPSAMPPPAETLFAPGQPAPEIAIPSEMPMSNQRAAGTQATPTVPQQMSWNEQSAEMPAPAKSSAACKFPNCDFSEFEALPLQ